MDRSSPVPPHAGSTRDASTTLVTPNCLARSSFEPAVSTGYSAGGQHYQMDRPATRGGELTAAGGSTRIRRATSLQSFVRSHG